MTQPETLLVSAAARQPVPQPEGTSRPPLDRAGGEPSATLRRLLAADRPDGSGFQSAI